MSSNTDNKIAYAGDVQIDEVVLISRTGQEYDLRGLFIEINLYEDIFAPCLTGNVVISDGQDLINALPIVGEELLRLRIGTPSFPDEDEIYKTFKIYSVSDKIPSVSDRTQGFTLNFISQEGYVDSVAYINGTFTGNAGIVAADIFDKNLKMPRNTIDGAESLDQSELVVLDNIKNVITFNSPSWSPFKCINYVASRSLRSDNDGSNFIFYETNKTFIFGSIQELIDMQAKQNFRFARYIYAPTDVRIPDVGNSTQLKKPNLDRSYSLVDEFVADEDFNLLNSNKVGHLANRVVTYDIINKQMKVNDYDYIGEWDKYIHVDKNSHDTSGKPVVSERQMRASNTCVMVYPQHPFLYNGNKDTTNKDIAKILSSRMSMLADITSRKISIVVPGRTDIECGVLIDFALPAFKTKDTANTEEDVLDAFYSGTYLVTAIRHKINQQKHVMRMELCKDSTVKKGLNSDNHF